MRGIDLSHWNGDTGKKILADNNVELDFCICKHSEGRTMLDKEYVTFSDIAEDRGILHGGYHFYVGNQCTSEYKKILVDRFAAMYSGGAALSFIDWERELDRTNGIFICDAIEEIRAATGRNVGIYASYSVFTSKNIVENPEASLALYCHAHEIPIWCARYKYSTYRQAIEYSDSNSIPNRVLQSEVAGYGVMVNQITKLCSYQGRNIDLDYDVAWGYGMG